MKRTCLATIAIVLATVCSVFSDDSAKLPNVVYIMADDLGIGDVKCYGGDLCQIETPNIDRLAADGMRFTDAHAIASVCVPTRVAVMTGRYPWRFARPPRPDGLWGYLKPRIPTNHLTLGSMLQAAGYTTGYVGKWHLGTEMQTLDGKVQGPTNVDFTKPLKVGPRQYGFDFSFILPGSLDMYPYTFVNDNAFVGSVTAQKGWSAFNRVGPAAEDFEDTKVLDAFSTQAEGFIQRCAEATNNRKPFFLYFALTSPHTPTSPSPQFEGKSKLGLYGDFVMETDHCVGRIMASLEMHNLSDNTLVIFTSDHGPASYAGNIRKATPSQLIELEKKGHHANGIYRGYKFSVYEGGLRVPYVVRWPVHVKAGSQCDRLIGLNDLMRTLADVTRYDVKDHETPDSISFRSLLSDPAAKPSRESMIMQSTETHVVRRGKWKLCLCPGSGALGIFGNLPKPQEAWQQAVKVFGRKPTQEEILTAPFVQLFDMDSDATESNNVAQDHPEVVRELVQLFHDQFEAGRSTPGKNLENDVKQRNPHRRIPKFVFE